MNKATWVILLYRIDNYCVIVKANAEKSGEISAFLCGQYGVIFSWTYGDFRPSTSLFTVLVDALFHPVETFQQFIPIIYFHLVENQHLL